MRLEYSRGSTINFLGGSKMSLEIRRAHVNDLSAVSDLAIKLVRQHQAYNERRFVNFENLETRYFELLAEQLKCQDAVILVAEVQKRIVGYAFVRLEEESLIGISDARAWLHDIYVDEAARGLGAGKLLLQAAAETARELGSQTLMLQVATQNAFARRLFESYGFQATMQEMMLDLSNL
jgi:GNAT superfamily N-acetyltransferase